MNYAIKQNAKDGKDSDGAYDDSNDGDGVDEPQMIVIDEETQELLSRHDPSRFNQ